MKNKFKKLIDFVIDFLKARPYSAILLFWILEWIWYGILNHLQTAETSHIMHTALDDSIPFCEWFIIPYWMWYFYIAGATLYTLYKSKKDFLRTVTMIYLGMFGSMMICTFYPSWHLLRPETMPDNILSWWVQFTYTLDNPAVIFPSMHVLVAFLITISLTFADCMKGKTRTKVLCWIYAVVVSASTVFVKQHSIKDVWFALVFIIPYTLLTYFVIWPAKRFKKEDQAITK